MPLGVQDTRSSSTNDLFFRLSMIAEVLTNLNDIMMIGLCCYIRIECGGMTRLGLLFHLLTVLEETLDLKIS